MTQHVKLSYDFFSFQLLWFLKKKKSREESRCTNCIRQTFHFTRSSDTKIQDQLHYMIRDPFLRILSTPISRKVGKRNFIWNLTSYLPRVLSYQNSLITYQVCGWILSRKTFFINHPYWIGRKWWNNLVNDQGKKGHQLTKNLLEKE